MVTKELPKAIERIRDNTCHYVKQDNTRCKAYHKKDSIYCMVHSGDNPKEQKSKVTQMQAKELVKDPECVSFYLADLMIQTRKKKIAPNIVNAIANLADKLLKIHDMREEKKYRELMIQITERRSLPSTVVNADLACLDEEE